MGQQQYSEKTEADERFPCKTGAVYNVCERARHSPSTVTRPGQFVAERNPDTVYCLGTFASGLGVLIEKHMGELLPLGGMRRDVRMHASGGVGVLLQDSISTSYIVAAQDARASA